MADVNKTIEIQMKADLAQLKKNLAQIPGMTKEEAQKMTKALQRELKQAQSAAKKTAQVNKRANKVMQQEFQKTANKAREVRKQSREMGAAFGSLEDVVGEVAPELGGLATTIGTVGHAFRSLSRSLATGNPLVLGLVVAVAALTAGYHLLTASSREAERQQKLTAEAAKQASEKYAKQADIVRDIVADQNAAFREQQVLFGQLSEAELEILKAKESIEKKTQKQLQEQEKFVKQQKELVKLADIAGDSSSQLTEEQQKTLEIAMKQSSQELVKKGLLDKQAGISVQMVAFKRELLEGLKKEEIFQRKIIDENQKTFDIIKENIAAKEELRKAEEEEELRLERLNKARAAAAKRRAELERVNTFILSDQERIEKAIRQGKAQLLQGEEKINAKFQEQNRELEKQKDALLDQAISAQDTARTEKERNEALRLQAEAMHNISLIGEQQKLLELNRLKEVEEFKEKAAEKEEKRKEKQRQKDKRDHDKRIQEQKQAIQISIKGIADFASAGLQLMEETGNKNKTLLNVLFKAQQAASLANIAMATAEAMTKALSLGPAAPLAQAAILAGAGAQAAVVLAQKPPLHMGGFVERLGPQEQTRTLLEGEAVLDRATTRRMGGEAGIRALQEGRNSQNVIVMNPFKHLDRYNRSALQNKNSSLGRLRAPSPMRY